MLYYPAYYSQFRCLAADCPDTCCAKWEINVDADSYEKYCSLNENDSSEILRNISSNSENELSFRLKEGRCPFLNCKNLCNIHISLGEGFTPQVCRQHPDFVEEYDSFTEITLSLSCPAAAQLIFNFSDSIDCYPLPVYNGEDEILDLLIKSRSRLLNKQYDNFSDLKNVLLDAASDDLLDIDMVYVAEHPHIDISLLESFYKLLIKIEILTENWKSILDSITFKSINYQDIEAFICKHEKIITAFCRYFIYRYYLKAVNGTDIYSIALFILISCYFCCFAALETSVTLEEILRLYSKEIEHFPDNIDRIIDFADNI